MAGTVDGCWNTNPKLYANFFYRHLAHGDCIWDWMQSFCRTSSWPIHQQDQIVRCQWNQAHSNAHHPIMSPMQCHLPNFSVWKKKFPVHQYWLVWHVFQEVWEIFMLIFSHSSRSSQTFPIYIYIYILTCHKYIHSWPPRVRGWNQRFTHGLPAPMSPPSGSPGCSLPSSWPASRPSCAGERRVHRTCWFIQVHPWFGFFSSQCFFFFVG